MEDFLDNIKSDINDNSDIEYQLVEELSKIILKKWNFIDYDKSKNIAQLLWDKSEYRLQWISSPLIIDYIENNQLELASEEIINIMYIQIMNMTTMQIFEANEDEALLNSKKQLEEEIDKLKTNFNKFTAKVNKDEETINKLEDTTQNRLNQTDNIPVGYMDFLVKKETQGAQNKLINYAKQELNLQMQIATKIEQWIDINKKLPKEKPTDKPNKEQESKDKIEHKK
jgi:hypothetical protein